MMMVVIMLVVIVVIYEEEYDDDGYGDYDSYYVSFTVTILMIILRCGQPETVCDNC